MSEETRPLRMQHDEQIHAARYGLLELIRGPMPREALRVVAMDTQEVQESPQQMVTIRRSEAVTLVRLWVKLVREAGSSFCEHCGTLAVKVEAGVLDRIDEFLQTGLISQEELRRLVTRNDNLPF